MKKNVRQFILLTTLATGTIHIINRFITTTAEMKNILTTAKGQFYNWKNGEIFYTKRGEGSPILLVHSLDPICSSKEWTNLIKKLEKNHTVYTIDLIGCGRSDKPFLTYTNFLYVQLITDFIKDVIGEKVDVIASNRSLSFVVLAHNNDKGIINRIVGINPPELESLKINPDKYATVRKTLLELPIIGTFVYHILISNANITKTFQERFYSKPQLVSTKIIDAFYEGAHKKNSGGKYLMASIEGHYTDNSINHALEKLDIPLYLIQSRYGNNFVKKIDEYCHLNDSIEAAYISNAKELPHLEVTDKLFEIIKMFLNN